MQIGSKPSEKVFIAKEGGDTFLVLSFEDRMLHLYQTVETLLNPSAEAIEAHKDDLYFWAKNTGMMSILSRVNSCTFEHAKTPEDVVEIIEELEVALDHIY
jgi:hypothetical protein